VNGVYSAGVEPTEEAEEEQLSTATPDTPTVDEPVGSTTPTRSDQDRGARRPELRPCLRAALVVVGLAGIAIVEPLLRLFGDNPTFFVASDLTKPEIVVFALLVALVPTLVPGLLEAGACAIGERTGRMVLQALVLLLGTALALTVLRRTGVSNDWVVTALALAVGGLILAATQTVPAFAKGLRVLAAAPVLFLAVFFLGSPTGRLLSAGEASAAEGVAVDNPAPIVVLHLDELPLASLLRADGSINEVRFPNFARLAAGSTWYRNASVAAPFTERSVPATITGQNPEGSQLPTSSDHPRNLFTLLGSTYEERVLETITQLCPDSVCDDAAPAGGFSGRVGGAMTDAGVVLGHEVLPRGVADGLPAVDGRWADFADAGNDRPAGGGSSAGAPDGRALLDSRIEDLDTAIGRLDDMGPGTLWFAHVLLPHLPWIMAPDGQYPTGGPNGQGAPEDGVWQGPVQVHQGLQRHLLQLAYLDQELGRIIDSLEQQGAWDDAFVAVLADHGVAFTEGQHHREPSPETENEIYRVPLFIKLPGQESGVTSDANVSNIDLLPTLVDALGVQTTWQFDGVSLAHGDVERPDGVAHEGMPDPPGTLGNPASFDEVVAIAARNQEIFRYGDGLPGLYQVGSYGALVGQGADTVPVTGDHTGGWQMWPDLRHLDPNVSLRPHVVDGQFSLETATPIGQEALIVVNGMVVGLAEVYEQGETGYHFTAVIRNDSLSDTGVNDVSLLLATGSPEAPEFRRVVPAF